MAKGRRHLIVVEDETWARFWDFAQRYQVTGFQRRPTVQATLSVMLEILERAGDK